MQDLNNYPKAYNLKKAVDDAIQDIFVVNKLIKQDAFGKVTRVEAKSENFEMFMQLDVNNRIYPMSVGHRFLMTLASRLNLDGTADTGYSTQLQGSVQHCCLTNNSTHMGGEGVSCRQLSVFHAWEAIQDLRGKRGDLECKGGGSRPRRKKRGPRMKRKGRRPQRKKRGPQMKVLEESLNCMEINASFGGHLMMLKGNPSYMSQLELDQTLYHLIRKL
ncbi:hypothetical protein CRYUN_Cryun05aG0177900 [Craigia yunnanensis]